MSLAKVEALGPECCGSSLTNVPLSFTHALAVGNSKITNSGGSWRGKSPPPHIKYLTLRNYPKYIPKITVRVY